MRTFRGAPMTHELAEQMFIGWLDRQPVEPATATGLPLLPYSWLVAAGKVGRIAGAAWMAVTMTITMTMQCVPLIKQARSPARSLIALIDSWRPCNH